MLEGFSGGSSNGVESSSDNSFSNKTSISDSENVEFSLRLQDGSGKIVRYGDVIWGMQDGFPWWPVLLCDPNIMDDLIKGSVSKSKGNDKNLLVFFYSTCEWCFIRPTNVSHWHTNYNSRCEGSFVKIKDRSKRKNPKRVRLTKSVSRDFFFVVSS